MRAVDHPLFEQIPHVLDLIVGRRDGTHGPPVKSDTEGCIGGIQYGDIGNESMVAAGHDLDRGASKWLIHCDVFDSPIGDIVEITWVRYGSAFSIRSPHTDRAVENRLRGLINIVYYAHCTVFDSGMGRETNTMPGLCRRYLNGASIQVKRHSLADQK